MKHFFKFNTYYYGDLTQIKDTHCINIFNIVDVVSVNSSSINKNNKFYKIVLKNKKDDIMIDEKTYEELIDLLTQIEFKYDE